MSVFDQFSLKGRSAIVTGAASGLGLAYAEVAAEAGAQVTLTDVDQISLQRETERLAAQGWHVRCDVLDVTDRAQVRAVFDAHSAACGSLDVAFANVGIDVGGACWTPQGERNPEGQIDNFDEARWDRSIQVNLTGTFNTLREAVRQMKRHGRGGSIVVTSSNAAVVLGPLVGLPYMPAKAGVTHMVRQLAQELAEFRIRVNAIAPGPFATNIAGGALKTDPAVRKAWDDNVPLGRVAETEQIKPLALYLASDASSYVTGTQVLIDGGMSVKRGAS